MKPVAEFVLDASVLVAFLRPNEPFHRDTDALLKILTLEPARLIIPSIAFAEIAAALARGENNTERALEAIAQISRLRGLRVVSIDETLGRLASQAAAHYRIRGCDAVYVALAESLQAVLITLDRQQRERAPGSIRAYTPADALAILM